MIFSGFKNLAKPIADASINIKTPILRTVNEKFDDHNTLIETQKINIKNIHPTNPLICKEYSFSDFK
jgi:hypothetical protein